MKTLTDQLAQYAGYHRDRRNIATHLIGIPMIVVAVATLLSRPNFSLSGMAVSPATAMTTATVLFYVVLDLRFGLTMAGMMSLALWAGAWFAAQTTVLWLACGIGLFVVGWVFQFVGHFYEGRKPAFLDDLIGLIIAPLFIVAELAFMLGLRDEVRQQVEAQAGKTRDGRQTRNPVPR
jgi:uncharacterized membrane protein YGL010W